MIPFKKLHWMKDFSEHSFKNVKTFLLELRSVHLKSEELITVHIFIAMPVYYLQLHFMQRVPPLLANNIRGSEKYGLWMFCSHIVYLTCFKIFS